LKKNEEPGEYGGASAHALPLGGKMMVVHNETFEHLAIPLAAVVDFFHKHLDFSNRWELTGCCDDEPPLACKLIYNSSQLSLEALRALVKVM